MNIKDIKVRTVNLDELIKYLSIKLPEKQELAIDKFAVFEDKFVIDSDCCFSHVEHYHIDNEIKSYIEISCRVKKFNDDKSYSIRMDRADFTKLISLENFISISHDVDLIEFIRYNYNPRITSNQNLLLDYIKQSYSK